MIYFPTHWGAKEPQNLPNHRVDDGFTSLPPKKNCLVIFPKGESGLPTIFFQGLCSTSRVSLNWRGDFCNQILLDHTYIIVGL